MRTGIDARYALRKSRRGIGNYIFHLLKEFSHLRPEGVTFYLYGDRAAEKEVVRYFQENSFAVRILGSPNLAWWEQVALPLAARRDRLDLLHCPANIAPVFFKPCPIVTTIHDVIEFRRRQFGDTKLFFRHRLSRLYRMGVLPRVARVSDAIITVSEFSRRDLAEVLKVPLERITVTYEAPTFDQPPGEREIFPEEIREIIDLKGQYIFALGAVDKRKNTAFLLEAYHGLPEEIKSRVPLVVAGVERPLAFAHLVGEGVYLYGFLPAETLAALYQNALFFIYPSLYEGFGLPVLEAMMYGTPVLCSGTTAVGEIADGAALLFNPTNKEDLQKKMIMLIEGPDLRRELTEKGKLHCRSFSWRRCAIETLSIYEQVVKKNEDPLSYR